MGSCKGDFVWCDVVKRYFTIQIVTPPVAGFLLLVTNTVLAGPVPSKVLALRSVEEQLHPQTLPARNLESSCAAGSKMSIDTVISC